MHLRQGEIVLVPVPFTDLSSRKRRPVIVVSAESYNEAGLDMVVVAMTSNPWQSAWSFVISPADVTEGRLNRPGTVRIDKIYALSQSLAVARFGRVSEPVMMRIRDLLSNLVAPNS
jgi:mRNA interferase MazF